MPHLLAYMKYTSNVYVNILAIKDIEIDSASSVSLVAPFLTSFTPHSHFAAALLAWECFQLAVRHLHG